MEKTINLKDLRTANYYDNEEWSHTPCLICGKEVEKIENKMLALARNTPRGEAWDDQTAKYMQKNYLHMDTDGNLYFFNEDVAEGHESQGCFPVGCDCMRKYKKLRASIDQH